MFPAGEIEQLSEEFETRTPQEILRWAIDAFSPHIALSSSFQMQSIPLLHMAAILRPDIPVLFLDTGYHFWETQMFREHLSSHWGLNVVDLYREARWDVFMRQHVRSLPAEDPDLCCFIHKVQPMQKALQDMEAWISGIRRDQTPVRAQAKILELQEDGLLKVNPLLNWTKEDIDRYSREHRLPAHPLYQRGYRSVGCSPCTIAIGLEQDERAGRWSGRGKVECGLHTQMFQHKDIADLRSDFRIDLVEVKE